MKLIAMALSGATIMLGSLGIAQAQGGYAGEPPEEGPPADPDEDFDEARVRGGFLIGGGAYIVPGEDANGGGAMLNFRIGAQITHIFSVYYQGQGMGGAVVTSSSALALATLYNNIMAGFTLAHIVDLGVGPSVDVIAGAFAGTGGLGAGTTVRPGADLRVAINTGGAPDEGEARRSGFSVGADLHPIFFGDVVIMSLTVGIGGEWY